MWFEFKLGVGIHSNGAAALTEKHPEIITQIKELASECKSTHCSVHQESFAMKTFQPIISSS